jgi:hypothetical protein
VRGLTAALIAPVVRAVFFCLLLFHSSDGSPIWISAAAITVLKPAPAHQDHLAKGTQTIIYTSTGKTFGVRELDQDIVGRVNACDKEP